MIFLQLFITFFQIGLFGFGGGYGMLSLIQTQTVTHHAWLTSAEFTTSASSMESLSSATYCGYVAVQNAGMGEWYAILGSATATLALVLPSCIIMVLICRVFLRYMDTLVVQSVMAGLRPAVVGLIAAAALMLMTPENFSAPSVNPWQFWISIIIFAATFFGTKIMKINPIKMICWAAFAGLMLLY